MQKWHLTLAVTVLTVVVIVIARELVHPMFAVCLGVAGGFFSASKLNIF